MSSIGEILRDKKRKAARNSSVPNGEGRRSSGLGYITLPSDIDRDAYIRGVFESGLVMILTSENQVIRDVMVPKHLLDELEFPTVHELGVLVNWVSLPKTSQIAITGIHTKPEDFYLYNQENVHVREKKTKSTSITEIRNLLIPNYSLIVSNDQSSDGGIFHKAHNTTTGVSSHIKVNCDGTLEVYADEKSVFRSEKLLEIQVGSADSEKSILTIDKSGNFNYIDRHGNSIKIEEGQMTIESPKILHGVNATEAAILGDKLKAKLDEILDGISALTVPTAMGPSGVPVNVATFTTIKASLDSILSTKNKIE